MKQVSFIQALHTLYGKSLRKPFLAAVREFGLVQAGDHIAVGLSGGKDSALLALLLEDLRQYGEIPFQLTCLAMDPGYAAPQRAQLEQNAALFGLSPVIFNTDVLRIAGTHAPEHPCFLCAKMRRGHLYQQAQALGCNKIALGHHYDDAVETVLLGMVYGGQVQAMLPKLAAKHYEGMQLIRPLYYVREAAVQRWADENNLTFLPCDCPAHQDGYVSKRLEIKRMLAQLEEENPQVPANILNSVKNVDTKKVLGWRDAQGKHSFLDGL